MSTGIALCIPGELVVTLLIEALSDLSKRNSLQSLDAFVHDLRSLYNVANVAFHVLSAPKVPDENPVLMVTYEPHWVQRYVDKDYFEIDPVVQDGARTFLPLDWSEIDRSSTRMRELFAEAESYGVGTNGITVPVRGPASERSLITLTSYEEEQSWLGRRPRVVSDLHVLAAHLHDRVMVEAGLRNTAIRPRLSWREKDCLQRLARGVPPKRIAFELGISISAVRLYLASAKSKLHARNTNEAIALAVRDDLILV